VEGLEKASAVVFKKCKEGDNLLYAKGGWRNWPKDIEQDDVLKWFNSLIGLFLGFIAEHKSVLKI
jgi:hypothetical protein